MTSITKDRATWALSGGGLKQNGPDISPMESRAFCMTLDRTKKRMSIPYIPFSKKSIKFRNEKRPKIPASCGVPGLFYRKTLKPGCARQSRLRRWPRLTLWKTGAQTFFYPCKTATVNLIKAVIYST